MPLENFKKIRKTGEWVAKYGTDLDRLFFILLGPGGGGGLGEKQRRTTTMVTIMMTSNTRLKMDISNIKLLSLLINRTVHTFTNKHMCTDTHTHKLKKQQF
jgi:hypothetical protein